VPVSLTAVCSTSTWRSTRKVDIRPVRRERGTSNGRRAYSAPINSRCSFQGGGRFSLFSGERQQPSHGGPDRPPTHPLRVGVSLPSFPTNGSGPRTGGPDRPPTHPQSVPPGGW
jgi:hypothetical protein